MTDSSASSADATPSPADAIAQSSGVAVPSPDLVATTTLAVLPGTQPTPASEPNNLGDGSTKSDSENGLGTDVPSGPVVTGMDPSTERILISVGSIGKIAQSMEIPCCVL